MLSKNSMQMLEIGDWGERHGVGKKCTSRLQETIVKEDHCHHTVYLETMSYGNHSMNCDRYTVGMNDQKLKYWLTATVWPHSPGNGVHMKPTEVKCGT